MNSEEGGVIYVGIDNDGNAIELDNLYKTQLTIKDRIKNNIAPSTLGLFDVVLEEVNEKTIIKVIISTGNKKPYYIRKYGRSPEGCYTRLGNSKQKMTEEMIEEVYGTHHQVSLKDFPSPRKDLTFRQLKIFYDNSDKTLDEGSFLANLGLLTDDGRYNYNVYLLADSNSVPIPVARYEDDDRQDILEAKECGFKSILTATNEILSMGEAYNRRYMHKAKTGNETAYMYEYDAVKEGIVNAVLHNDYTMSSTPSINFYCDRIEIISAGGLPQGLTKEAFFKGVISRRNPELVKVFQDVHLIENLGSGMRKIMKYYGESCFEFVGKYTICTFKYKPNPFVDQDATGARKRCRRRCRKN